jgi:hypothetical protein
MIITRIGACFNNIEIILGMIPQWLCLFVLENDKPKKSGIVVELSNLGFRLLSTGNLTGEELDSALDILHDNVQSHERKSLSQLQGLYNALKM